MKDMDAGPELWNAMSHRIRIRAVAGAGFSPLFSGRRKIISAAVQALDDAIDAWVEEHKKEEPI